MLLNNTLKGKVKSLSFNSNYSLEYCFALLRVENNPLWERRVRPSVKGPNLPIYILTIHTVWNSDPPWPLRMALKVKIQNVDETYTKVYALFSTVGYTYTRFERFRFHVHTSITQEVNMY
jgi:hypothetical protein